MLSFIKKINKSNNNKSYLKRSYAQSGEDLLVDFIFHEIGIREPSYIDIGAHHPYYLNNTAIFYERGCQGINVEPTPHLFEAFVSSRKRDINLNIGIGEKETTLDFYELSTPTLNTFSKAEAESYSSEGNFTIKNIIPIKVETVSNIVDRYHHGRFPDFLSLDVEGLDEVIIHSIDFERNFPKIICVETLTFSTSGRGEKNTTLISFLQEKGYLLYADTNINSIFVRQDLWLR